MTERTSRAEAERFLSLPSEAESLVEGDCFSFADRVATDSKRLAEDYIALLDENERMRGLLRGVLMNINSDDLAVATMSSDTRSALDLAANYLFALHAAEAPGADGEAGK